MPNLDELCGGSFFNLHARVLREKNLTKSEFHRFIDTLLETEYILDDSGQGNLSDKESPSEWFILLGGDNRCDGREIDSRLGDRESSRHIDIDIIALKFRVAPLGEDRDEEIYLPARYSTCRALRIAEFRIGRERLYLDNDRAISLERDTECGS